MAALDAGRRVAEWAEVARERAPEVAESARATAAGRWLADTPRTPGPRSAAGRRRWTRIAVARQSRLLGFGGARQKTARSYPM